ncbi:MAG: M12 family metallo-peptidase [Chryseobacterium sp.]|jgi:hypothetical protein|uniref:zinc-dependent metalloprotease n=1 Tax=Chryseobacterium sp. TaxID=1871047 RepID=UPI0028325899|nr:zinc-dependent metalloprotease family protein [Chryseobacterium sp.]MDR2237536.1 M12 family metallo-peptidase [Chryseobacterium sp.]
MKKRILLVCALTAGVASFNAQRWEPASQKTSEIRKEVEVKYSYRVDLQSLRNILKDAVETGKNAQAVIVSLPTAEGKIEKFAVYSDPVMEKSLADRYQLGSYVGVGIDDPSKYLRFSTSPTEMQSMIIKDGKFQFIEPISTDKKTYGVFYKTKRTQSEHGFECTSDEKNLKDIKLLEANGKKNLSNLGITNRPATTKYRTYRLALSVTGEYTQYFMAQAGVPATATEDEKKAPAIAAMNNTMTRVNGVFQKEFAIKLLLQDHPNIVYTNPATDPYSDSDEGTAGEWNVELMNTLHNNVGEAAFDIGHLFGGDGGGGNAGCIGCICSDDMTLQQGSPVAYKGSGYTSPYDAIPMGEGFDIDYVAHELGHQLGGNHTFSNRTENSGVNVEPGGGTTIMGYAGITPDNVQMSSDAYYHYVSINQILNRLDSKSTCGVAEIINTNTAPVISQPPVYNIPKGTAYYLDATATDADNNPLTYTWEQYDSVNQTATISGDTGWGYNTLGALTRSYFGTSSGRRYFPSLDVVMAGKLTDKTKWETVSYIPRTLKYAITVRDESITPLVVSAETTVVVKSDGPFKFNGLTDATTLYNNANNTILWDVANTNSAPYNVSNVKIEYTTDLTNGSAWTELVASTPNTGTYTGQMPPNLTGPVKLRISAIGNIFYAVSPKVIIGSAPTSTMDAPTGVSTTDVDVLKTSARVGWNSVPGATYAINYRKQGTTSWANVVSPESSVLLNALEDETNYEVQVAAVVNNVPGAYSAPYTFKTKGLKTGIDYCILNTGANYVGNVAKVTVANVDYTDTNFRSYKDVSENPAAIINLTKGTSYPITIFGLYQAGAPMTYNVFIDYNRNGVFETNERVYASPATNFSQVSGGVGIGNVSGNFTVPETAYSGDKTLRMRVASNYFSELNNPCGTLANGAGSVMDFTVKISGTLAVGEVKDPKSSEISIYPNPADTFVEVKNLKGKASYKIYSADGRLVQDGAIDGQRINVASLIKGMYVITIKDDKNTYNTKLIKK